MTFAGLVGLYLLTALVLSGIAVEKEAGPEEMVIYIKTNGVHTDIVMPVRNVDIDWSREFRFSHTALTDTAVNWLGVGWGDKGFYLETPEWKDLKARVAFNAAFGLGNTAIHATYYKSIRESASCRRLMISREQYRRLINYISNSLERDSLGQAQHIVTDANYGNSDAFYEAVGS
ncbi:MAG: TIGR02117 family protein, partial [Sphingobacteriales bacterium]